MIRAERQPPSAPIQIGQPAPTTEPALRATSRSLRVPHMSVVIPRSIRGSGCLNGSRNFSPQRMQLHALGESLDDFDAVAAASTPSIRHEQANSSFSFESVVKFPSHRNYAQAQETPKRIRVDNELSKKAMAGNEHTSAVARRASNSGYDCTKVEKTMHRRGSLRVGAPSRVRSHRSPADATLDRRRHCG